MAAVSKNEHPFAGEVRGVHRCGVPRQFGTLLSLSCIGCLHAKEVVGFCEEIGCRSHSDGHRSREGNPKLSLHPAATGFGNFCIEADIEISLWKAHDVGHRCLERHNSIHINAMTSQ